jgi:L-amino acid N-acyltransferase YncA
MIHFIDIEKARIGLVAKKVTANRKGKSYQTTVYVKPNVALNVDVKLLNETYKDCDKNGAYQETDVQSMAATLMRDIIKSKLSGKNVGSKCEFVVNRRQIDGAIMWSESKERVWVDDLTVHPKLINGNGSGKGVGSALLHRVIKYAYKNNKPVELSASANAIGYYKKVGFEKKYPTNKESTAFIMTPKRIKELYGN